MNFITNNPEEIKKEKEKNAALHSLFPLTMGGSEDKTNYYLIDKNKPSRESVHKENNKLLNDAYNKGDKFKNIKVPKVEVDIPEEPIDIFSRPSTTNRHLRTFNFAKKEPTKALEIGLIVPRSTNISSNASRFSTADNVLYGVTLKDKDGNVLKDKNGNSTREEEERGSEKGAFRHTIWQAKLASKYGKNIAKRVGNVHENDPYVNLFQRSFKNIDDADQTVDLLNNMIGRRIGETCQTGSMRDMAFMVLDEFRYNGLYTAEPDENGIWQVKKRRLSQEKYDILKEHYKRADENGYLPEELEEALMYERKHFFTPKKIWDLLEYLIKSSSGY